MTMDSFSFGMIWLLGYAGLEDQDETFKRDLHTVSEAADLSRALAVSIYGAHRQDLNRFFDSSLAQDEGDRCSDFYYL